LLFHRDDGIVVVNEVTRTSNGVGKAGVVRKTAMAVSKGMTLAEYLDSAESLLPQELVDGVLHVADAPLVPHQLAVRDFLIALASHVQERDLGEVVPAPMDIILDPARPLVVQPDLLFVSNERRSIMTDKIDGAPDLVLEVLSPHPRVGRMQQRVEWFAQYGVRECWLYQQDQRRLAVLVLKNRSVAERRIFNRPDPIHSDVLPDFHRTLDDVLRWTY
jgi:Uma2 family endonuclease